jgi:hypothetical protein
MHKSLINDVSETLKKIDNGEINFCVSIGKNNIGIFPSLALKSKNSYMSDQSEHFSFYLLRTVFRGINLSVNFLAGGVKCQKENLYGPSTLLFYSSAFHTLNAYLAINGRVIVKHVLGINQKILPDVSIFAIFNNEKKEWSINKSDPKHKDRWILLKDIFGKKNNNKIPKSFNNLFQSLYNPDFQNRIIKNSIFKEYYKDEKELNIETKLKEFLELIAQKRHTSVYNTFGSNPEVIQDIENGDTFSDFGIDFHSNAFAQFANEFFEELLDLTIKLLENITIGEESKKALYQAIYTPSFDTPVLNLLSIQQQEKLNIINLKLNISSFDL